ncbi:hypothetical protein EB061_05760 [bacterium]|nr:hypothetical protein [bacterium]
MIFSITPAKIRAMSPFRLDPRTAYSALVIPGAFAMVMLGAGCGLVSGKAATGECATGTAQLGVYDTGMKRICGCNESAGAFFTSKTLTCTVKVGTALYFNYIGITNSHQLILQAYQSLPVRGPGTTTPDAILLNLTGSYSLTDNFNGMGGTITVTP